MFRASSSIRMRTQYGTCLFIPIEYIVLIID